MAEMLMLRNKIVGDACGSLYNRKFRFIYLCTLVFPMFHYVFRLIVAMYYINVKRTLLPIFPFRLFVAFITFETVLLLLGTK